jgi:hypothetical protein
MITRDYGIWRKQLLCADRAIITAVPSPPIPNAASRANSQTAPTDHRRALPYVPLSLSRQRNVVEARGNRRVPKSSFFWSLGDNPSLHSARYPDYQPHPTPLGGARSRSASPKIPHTAHQGSRFPSIVCCAGSSRTHGISGLHRDGDIVSNRHLRRRKAVPVYIYRLFGNSDISVSVLLPVPSVCLYYAGRIVLSNVIANRH